jgi:sugar phosphate isomerase/epimerase
MKIGLSSYTWPWAVGRAGHVPDNPLDVRGMLEKTKGYGIDVLQIADNPALHLLPGEELESIARTAGEYGITLEVGTRGIEPSHLMRYLGIAKTLGSALVRSITRAIGADALSMIREVLPEYREAGVSIALENHDEHGTGELAAFLERIGSPFVGVCLDTVNSFAALETPDRVVDNLAPYTLNLHVKDFEVVRFGSELGFSIVGRPAGGGRLDVAWLLGRLKDEGRDPNAILELWTPYTNNLAETIALEEEWAARSLEYLRTIIH